LPAKGRSRNRGLRPIPKKRAISTALTRQPFRKAYLESLIGNIEVDDDQIRIKGDRDVLEQAVLAQRNLDAEGSQMSTKGRRRDSNSCRLDS
jgi:hypothetical protein